MKFDEVRDLFVKEKEIIKSRWRGDTSYMIKNKIITSIQAKKLIKEFHLKQIFINAMTDQYIFSEDLI